MDPMRDSFRTSTMKIPLRATINVERRKTCKFHAFLVLASVCILGTLWPIAGAVYAASGQTEKQSPADLQRLEGRWVRPDGGYLLELREIKKDGSLKALYFNPRPINVLTARWIHKDGKTNLFVELRDVNYPGSKYNLQYDPKSDRLKGTYFQAVEKQTFNIEFVRAK
jgi:hypothetical protein